MTTATINGSVVVGVDGSPHSEVAIEWAARYAVEHNRPLTILHGAGSVARASTLDPSVTRQSLRMEGRRITDAALALAQKAAPGHDIRVHVPLLEAKDALIDASEHCHLIVLGHRGRGKVASVLLGSVSVSVSAHADCPVVVVRPLTGEDGHIVVGVDGTDSSMAALEFAFDMASWQKRKLDVVNTWGGDTPYPSGLIYEQRRYMNDEHSLRVAESIAGFAEKYPDVVTAQYVVENAPEKALEKASETAALVVVGSRGRNDATAMLLGSVSRSVVEHAKCTVAVVRRH